MQINDTQQETLDTILGGQASALSSSTRLTLGGALKLFIETHHLAAHALISSVAAGDFNVSLVKQLREFLAARDFDATVLVGVGFKRMLVNPCPKLVEDIATYGEAKTAETLSHAVVRVSGMVIDLCYLRLGDTYEQVNNFALRQFQAFWKETRDMRSIMAITPDLAKELARSHEGFTMGAPSALSASAPAVVKGSRVVVKAAKDEWYTGTVTRVGAKSISVTFDDHATAVIQAEDWAEIRPMILDYKSDESLTDSEANPLWNKRGTRSKVTIDLGATKAKPVAEVKKLLGYGQPKVYAALRGSRNPALIAKWMRTTWTILNAAYFGAKMHQPAFVVLSYADEHKHKIGGVWNAKDRQFCLGVSIFDEDEATAMHALAHVMSHQAVSDVDKLAGVGHGKAWQDHMRHVDPTAPKADLLRDVPYMEQFELPDSPIDAGADEDAEDAGPVKSALPTVVPPESKKKSTVGDRQPLAVAPDIDTPVMIWNASGIWRKGLALGGQDRGTADLAVLTMPSSDRYQRVPLENLYRMDPEAEDRSRFSTPAWIASATRVSTALGLVLPLLKTFSNYYGSVTGTWLARDMRHHFLPLLPDVTNPNRVIMVTFELARPGASDLNATKAAVAALFKLFLLDATLGRPHMIFAKNPPRKPMRPADALAYDAFYSELGFTRSGNLVWMRPTLKGKK